jgi:hypothetical protein
MYNASIAPLIVDCPFLPFVSRHLAAFSVNERAVLVVQRDAAALRGFDFQEPASSTPT